MSKPKPPRLDVFLPKFQAEKEKQEKLAAIAFKATWKPSKWLR